MECVLASLCRYGLPQLHGNECVGCVLLMLFCPSPDALGLGVAAFCKLSCWHAANCKVAFVLRDWRPELVCLGTLW